MNIIHVKTIKILALEGISLYSHLVKSLTTNTIPRCFSQRTNIILYYQFCFLRNRIILCGNLQLKHFTSVPFLQLLSKPHLGSRAAHIYGSIGNRVYHLDQDCSSTQEHKLWHFQNSPCRKGKERTCVLAKISRTYCGSSSQIPCSSLSCMFDLYNRGLHLPSQSRLPL